MGKAKLTIKDEIFTRGVEDIIGGDELDRALKAGKSLRIKHGIDATAPGLHIGHAASLWKLRALQDAGHKAVILLGDTTTRIGDPTGKTKTRPELSETDIKKNIASIKKEINCILRTEPRVFELRQSSEWYNRFKLKDFLRLLSWVTHARLIERSMFQERIKKGGEIYMHELIYPILQGYDSVELRSDLTIIGSDQLFNEHMGRFFQEKLGQAPQAIISLKILPGLEGKEKMSKSLGNYVGLADPPADKFGKIMSIPDDLIIPYLEVYTDVPREKISSIGNEIKAGGNPMNGKLFLAEAVVARYHGEQRGYEEKARFLQIFSRRETPQDAESVVYERNKDTILDLVVKSGGAASRAEARRLLQQGAVDIGGKIIKESGMKLNVPDGTALKVGKRKFYKIENHG